MTHRHRCFIFIFGVLLAPALVAADEMRVGSKVTLVARERSDGSDLGIPGHTDIGVRSVSKRFASGSAGVIEALGGADHMNWIKIRVDTESHWIVTKYVASVESVWPAIADADEEDVFTYVVGCWNIEWLHDTKARGFPENTGTPPGPTFPARTDVDIAGIAEVILERTNMCFVVLCEINGRTGVDEDEEPMAVSDELDVLLTKFPESWEYTIAESGRAQRVAFLYDTVRCRVNEIIEYEVPRRIIQRKDIFERDPMAAHVTFLRDEQPHNDVVIVGVHLASGQANNRNHDEAMDKLLSLLEESREANELGGPNEHDVLIMGDYNANAFRPPVERFFVDMDLPDGDWDVLAGADYPATRLSGVPLDLRTSQIDYIIATRKRNGTNGLVGEEILASSATVHTELLNWKPPLEFRRSLSDHLPVTVKVRVMADDD